jgi:hypothetical protein
VAPDRASDGVPCGFEQADIDDYRHDQRGGDQTNGPCGAALLTSASDDAVEKDV